VTIIAEVSKNAWCEPLSIAATLYP